MSRKLVKLLLGALLCSLPAAAARADGAVYAMTNQIGGNQVVAYHRGSDGNLTIFENIATRGGGSGPQLSPPIDSLGSQGSLILDKQHHLLFAVNTESLAPNSQDCQRGTITSFRVAHDGSLVFADRVASGGLFPASLTVRRGLFGDLLYVLNAGGPGATPPCGVGPNITGFKVTRGGVMTPLAGAVQPIDPGALGGTGSGVNCPVGGFPQPAFNCGLNPPAFPRGPAQVRFTPAGDQLIVTVKSTSSIYVFPLNKRGVVGAPTVTQAPGPALPTDFGLTFDKQGHLLVTEAFGSATSIPAPSTGAVSSYTINKDGTLTTISQSVSDGGTAACWIALDPVTGKFAFVSNNLSDSISTYSVGSDGSLSLLAAVGAAASGPNDQAAVSDSGRSFLYVLNSANGSIGAFQINTTDGTLIPLAPAMGLPANAAIQGLAAY